MRKRILKIFVGFFIIMLCCTVIARAADSVTIARVKVVNLKRGRLTETVTGTGKVSVEGENAFFLPENQKVKNILVKKGQSVQNGEVLIQLDMEYLQERIDEKNRETEKLQLQIEQQKLAGQEDARTPETASAQISLNSAERGLTNAQNDYNQAVDAYNSYINSAPDIMDEEQAAEYESQVQNLLAGIDEAKSVMDSQAEAYNQAVENYNLAAQNEANIQANNEKQAQANNLSVQSLQIDLEAASQQLQKLIEIQNTEGKIYAEEEGVVKSIGVSEGTVTTGSEQIVIGTGEFVAKGILSSEDMGILQIGDKADILFPGKSKAAEVEILQISQENADAFDSGEQAGADVSQMSSSDGTTGYGVVWKASLPEGEYTLGSTFTYEINKESEENFEQIIPISALRESNGKAWVLIAEKSTGILGEEYRAAEAPVTVLDKDEKSAAVSCALGRDAEIISESEKYVKAGDRVRIEK